MESDNNLSLSEKIEILERNYQQATKNWLNDAPGIEKGWILEESNPDGDDLIVVGYVPDECSFEKDGADVSTKPVLNSIKAAVKESGGSFELDLRKTEGNMGPQTWDNFFKARVPKAEIAKFC